MNIGRGSGPSGPSSSSGPSARDAGSHRPAGMDAKRAIDIAVATAGIVVTSPVIAACALAIRLTDPGPVFFRQQRVGLGGKPFRIHKFRSMRVASSGSRVTSAHDSRITPVGAVLRKTKLDELPQLFDVLSGTMSLVGPRPEVQHYVDMWDDQAKAEILSVRPGITDPASIVFRNEQDELAAAEDPEQHYVHEILPRKVTMYREYVRTRSLAGDAKIVARTLATVIKD